MAGYRKIGAGAALLAFVLAASFIALAQQGNNSEPPAPGTVDGARDDGDSAGRYVLEPAEDGFVRLDRETGQMSFCRQQAGRLSCRLAADERQAYEAEIARLQERVELLEEGLSGEPGATEDRQKSTDRLPATPQPENEEERQFEKAMDYAERALRRLFDVIKELGTDLQKESEGR